MRYLNSDAVLLQRENERLRLLQPGPEELAVLQTAAAEHAKLERAASTRAKPVAAAGGDVASLQSLLYLDPDAHARAAALLAQLPAVSRALYSSPEQLISAFTIKNVPLGSAQVAWHAESQSGFAEALIYLRELPPASSVLRADDPLSPLDMKITKTVHLTFQQGPSGWRVVVPLAAIERIEHELAK